MGTVIVGIVLVGVVALVIRSLWKNHAAGKTCGGCSGDCSHCNSHH
ncbi:MAG: FeoB-associated Cys-rich membrane protein [Bacillota bacterium]